jgi:phthiocerol/phenolphthiocerol synthesis type-I polyketide synthase E
MLFQLYCCQNYLIWGFTLRTPNRQIISNLTGTFMSPEEAIDPQYWSSHIRNTVLFSEGIKTIQSEYPNAVYIELGPGDVLSNFVRQHGLSQNSKGETPIPLRAVQAIFSARKFKSLQGSSNNLTLEALGKLWCYGYKLDWRLIHKNRIEDLSFVSNLPSYQFDELKCWIEKPKTDSHNSKKILNKIINILTKENVVIPKEIVEKIHKEVLQVDKNEQVVERISENKILIDKDATELEMKLASIFYEVLGVEKMSKNDSFFELGGNSLTALHLVIKINNYFNLKLTPSILVNNYTIHRIGLQLSHNKKSDIIVELKDGSGVPIFLIHPVGGDLLCYKEFCDKYIGKNKIYGIRDPKYSFFYDNNISSIEDMAGLYVQEVRKRHSSGPYIIGGLSFGGVVAYEMTNKLINNNENVLTFMIDTPGPKRLPAELKSSLAILDYFLSYDETKENAEIRKKLKSFAADEVKLFDYVISNKIAGFDDESVLKKMMGIFLNNLKMMHKYKNPDNFKGEFLLYFKALEVNHNMPDQAYG